VSHLLVQRTSGLSRGHVGSRECLPLKTKWEARKEGETRD
jgi:hypothetical protein